MYSVLLFQRLSVEYTDTVFDKLFYAVIAAPFIHFLTFCFLKFAPWDISVGYAQFNFDKPVRFISEYREFVAYLISDAPSGENIPADTALRQFGIYSIASFLVAVVSSYLATKIFIMFFGGFPGFRRGIYSIVNGPVKPKLVASVLCTEPSSEKSYIIYTGIVDQIRVRKTGEIVFIYLNFCEKRVASFKEQIVSDELEDRIDEVFQSHPSSLLNEQQLRLQLDEQDDTAMPNTRARLSDRAGEQPWEAGVFISGEHIANIYFVPWREPAILSAGELILEAIETYAISLGLTLRDFIARRLL
ncbi:hypothetical protein [Oceanicaulis sp.]|uniref:hypothetical protein n=1 Tax=Oceanicaulis sp. TaxID=1924941 RepID=UPI003F6F9AFF